jgi:hypothetical protein
MESLARDLVCIVLQHLDIKSLGRVAQVSRRLCDVCGAADVWRRVFVRDVVAPLAYVEGDETHENSTSFSSVSSSETSSMHPREQVRRATTFQSFYSFRQHLVYVGRDDPKHRGTLYVKGRICEHVVFVPSPCRVVGIDTNGVQATIVGRFAFSGDCELRNLRIEYFLPSAEEDRDDVAVVTYANSYWPRWGVKFRASNVHVVGTGDERPLFFCSVERSLEETYLDNLSSDDDEQQKTQQSERDKQLGTVEFAFENCEFSKSRHGMYVSAHVALRANELKVHDVTHPLVFAEGSFFVANFHVSGISGCALVRAEATFANGTMKVTPGFAGVTSGMDVRQTQSLTFEKVHFLGGSCGLALIGSAASLRECRMTGQVGCAFQLRNMLPVETVGSHAFIDGLEIDGGSGDGLFIEELSSFQGSGLHVLGAAQSAIQLQEGGRLNLLRNSTIVGCQGHGIVLMGALGKLDNVSISGCKEGAIAVKQKADLSAAEMRQLAIKSCAKPSEIEFCETEPRQELCAFRDQLAACGDSAAVLRKVDKLLGQKDFPSIDAYAKWVNEESRRQHVCTKKICGKVFLAIPQFDCYSCQLTNDRGLGVCSYCKDAHHLKEGHSVSFAPALQEGNEDIAFYCDCACEL